MEESRKQTVGRLKLLLNFMQYQMFIAVYSTPMNNKKIFFDKFQCPHRLRVHDITVNALNHIIVFN